LQHVIIQANRL